MAEPDNLVLNLLRGIRDDIAKVDQKVDNLDAKVNSLGADVASDLLTLEKRLNDKTVAVEKRLNEQLVALRRSVMEYHSTAVGHGLLYSELEERVRRIEQRLETTP